MLGILTQLPELHTTLRGAHFNPIIHSLHIDRTLPLVIDHLL